LIYHLQVLPLFQTREKKRKIELEGNRGHNASKEEIPTQSLVGRPGLGKETPLFTLGAEFEEEITEGRPVVKGDPGEKIEGVRLETFPPDWWSVCQQRGQARKSEQCGGRGLNKTKDLEEKKKRLIEVGDKG